MKKILLNQKKKNKSPSSKIKNNFNQNNNNEKKDFMHLIDKYTQPNKCAKDLIHNRFYSKKNKKNESKKNSFVYFFDIINSINNFQ